MQFSLRSMLLLMFVLAVLLAELASGQTIVSSTVWVLVPAALVTLILRGPGPDRIAASAALATYATICLTEGRLNTSTVSTVIRLGCVAGAYGLSRVMQKNSDA